MMTLNPTGDAKKELDRLHSELIKTVDKAEILKEQKKDYATIFKALERKGDKLAHMYLIGSDRLLKRIVRDNNIEYKVTMVPKCMVKFILHEVHEIVAHPGDLKTFMFVHWRYF